MERRCPLTGRRQCIAADWAQGMTDYGIDHFHMNRFENRQGPFKTWPNHRRIHRLNRLMTITNRHTLASADKSVDRVDARGRRSAAGR